MKFSKRDVIVVVGTFVTTLAGQFGWKKFKGRKKKAVKGTKKGTKKSGRKAA